MKTFIKLVNRKPFTMSLMVFLSLSITISNIGFSAWIGGSKQTELINEKYVTIAVAVLIGNALAVVLYDRITQMLLSASPELSYGGVALCGAVQFLVLFVVGMIWIRSVANRNLMQKR